MKFILLCLAWLLSSSLAIAQPADPTMYIPEPKVYTGKELETIRRVQTYLANITSFQASFKEYKDDGTLYGSGQIFAKRPWKLRIEYRPPVYVQVVGDGSQFVYYDSQLDEVNYVSRSESKLDFLIGDTVNLFDPELYVTAVEKDGFIAVSIRPRRNTEAPPMILYLDRASLRLQQWQYFDNQGKTRTLKFTGLSTNLTLQDRLFIFARPIKKTGSGAGR